MIYFVRHGETDFNKFNISQGQLETSLNSLGLEQAKQIAEQLKNYTFDVIYCSTLTRARQTVEFINKYHNLPICFDGRLKEVNKGVLQGQRNPQEVYDKFFADPHKYEGETEEDVVNRIYEFLNDIKHYKGKNVLIVGHGGIHKYFDFCLKGKSLKNDKLTLTKMNNCEVVEFEF
ncbi:MAG: histidine phosphatase family protein [Clostridia bacterium]|nr:histidine phosphatase family protein [Clostridia bacterium]